MKKLKARKPAKTKTRKANKIKKVSKTELKKIKAGNKTVPTGYGGWNLR